MKKMKNIVLAITKIVKNISFIIARNKMVIFLFLAMKKMRENILIRRHIRYPPLSNY